MATHETHDRPTTIRLATRADLPIIPELEVRAGERFRELGLDTIADDDPPTIEELREPLSRRTLWVAEGHDGTLLGYARASVVDDERHLDQVSVDPAAQGGGVGRALVEQVCGWAAGAGFSSVTLTTFTDVPFNGPLYEHLGFVTLPDAELGPELRLIRDEERRAGLDLRPRCAMRRRVPRSTGGASGAAGS